MIVIQAKLDFEVIRMNDEVNGKVLDYVEIRGKGESAFGTCAESIADRMKDKKALIIQSVFDFGENDVPFAMRLVRDVKDVIISFANADWQFYYISKDGETYKYCHNPSGNNLSALDIYDSLVGSFIITSKPTRKLKETLEDILKSEYFCDEPEDPFSEEPWNPDDEEHELSYYVIYEET